MIKKIKNFKNENSNEKQIIIPSTVKQIGVGAFEFSNIESIVIPSSVEHIRTSAFKGCKNLKSVIFETSDCTVNKQAFLDCESLETVENFPDKERISEKVFQNCVSLKNITFANESIESIYYNAFDNCISLESITLPMNLKEIASEAFLACKKLETINVNNNLRHVGACAFADCSKLTRLDFSKAYMESIDFYAFRNCRSLFEVVFDNIVSINENAFEGCHLQQIIMSNESYANNERFVDNYKKIILKNDSLDALIASGKSFKEISKIYKSNNIDKNG